MEIKEERYRWRDNPAGAKALRQVGETAGRPVCLEWSEVGGVGRGKQITWGSQATGRTSWQEEGGTWWGGETAVHWTILCQVLCWGFVHLRGVRLTYLVHGQAG